MRAGNRDDAVAAWKRFVRARGKKLGAKQLDHISAWLTRAAYLEQAGELELAADRLRYHRETQAALMQLIASIMKTLHETTSSTISNLKA